MSVWAKNKFAKNIFSQDFFFLNAWTDNKIKFENMIFFFKIEQLFFIHVSNINWSKYCGFWYYLQHCTSIYFFFDYMISSAMQKFDLFICLFI